MNILNEPMTLSGMIIEHRSIGAEYVLLLVGLEVGIGQDEPDTHYWQALAVGQMNHRLWMVPKTTAEVEHEFYAGRIVDAGRMDWPVCKDSRGCSV